MNRFMRWWNKDKIREQKINDRLTRMETEFTAKLEETQKILVETELELEESRKELEVFRKQEEADAARRTSPEPWVEIKGDKIDPVKGIQIELDWNDAFIQYLKDNGLAGKDEDTIVQKWLAMLYVNLLDGLEEQVIENSDIVGPSEFE